MKSRLIATAVAVGLGVTTLAACGPDNAGTESPTGGELRTGEAYDPKAFSGESINVLLIEHPFVNSVKPLLADFEAETGIKVEFEVFSEQQGFDKIQADLSAGSGNYDIVMTDPLHNWQYSAAGWLEPLESYVANDAITMPEYDAEDFVPGIFDAGKWNLELGQGIGEGSLWALPINFESYNLTYRPSLLAEAGVEVPQTYAELLMATETLAETLDGNTYPIVTRFDRYWDLTYLTWASMAQSYGVTLLDENGEVAIDSPQGVQAAEDFLEIVKAGSPNDASAFTWYEVLQGMVSGRFAIAMNEADLFAATYENPNESQIAEDVGYALVPEGPAGRATGAWIWQLSMNSGSVKKGAAWTFLQWLTSPEVLVQTNLNGNMNPVRESAWANEELDAMVKEWGEYPGQYREVLEATAEIAEIRFPPHPELTRVLDMWAEALQTAYFDGDVEGHLKSAADDIRSVLG